MFVTSEVFFNDLFEFSIDLSLANILTLNGVARVTHLVRNRSINQREELFFSFGLVIQNIFGDINNLEYLLGDKPSFKFQLFDLEIFALIIISGSLIIFSGNSGGSK